MFCFFRDMASRWTDFLTFCLRFEISTMKHCSRNGPWCSGELDWTTTALFLILVNIYGYILCCTMTESVFPLLKQGYFWAGQLQPHSSGKWRGVQGRGQSLPLPWSRDRKGLSFTQKCLLISVLYSLRMNIFTKNDDSWFINSWKCILLQK